MVDVRVPEDHERSGVDEHTHGEFYHSPVKAYKGPVKDMVGHLDVCLLFSICHISLESHSETFSDGKCQKLSKQDRPTKKWLVSPWLPIFSSPSIETFQNGPGVPGRERGLH